MKKIREYSWIGLLAMMLSSCTVVTGIFKAGVWAGIFAVVAVIVIIILIVRGISRKS